VAGTGKPPNKAKGFNGGLVPVVVGLSEVGVAAEKGKEEFVLGEPGAGNEEEALEGGKPKPPAPKPASRIMVDICNICRRDSGLELYRAD
jgi:hypothetical protein